MSSDALNSLTKGLSKFSTASLLHFIALILTLAGMGIMTSIAPYFVKFIQIAYKLSLHLISRPQIPSWFFAIATKLMIAGVLMIIALILEAVSAYAFLWSAFSRFSEYDRKFSLASILVKVGLAGYTAMIVAGIAYSQYIRMQIQKALTTYKASPISLMLYIKSIQMSAMSVAYTIGALMTIFYILTISGICVGLYHLRRLGNSGLFTACIVLLVIDLISYLASSGGIRMISSMLTQVTTLSILGSVSFIAGIIACILIFIGCRILKSRISTELATSIS